VKVSNLCLIGGFLENEDSFLKYCFHIFVQQYTITDENQQNRLFRIQPFLTPLNSPEKDNFHKLIFFVLTKKLFLLSVKELFRFYGVVGGERLS
jgi:hypothetical protein